MKRLVVLLVLFFVVGITNAPVQAQCPMCKAAAESSIAEGNKKAKGLNNGILYLLAMPYIAVTAVGFMWYRNYRNKSVSPTTDNLNVK